MLSNGSSSGVFSFPFGTLDYLSDNVSSGYSMGNRWNDSNFSNFSQGTQYNSDEPSLLDYVKNVFTGELDYKRQLHTAQQAQAFSSREAEKQRKFEKMMSDTAYSRAIKDLRNAGVNPYAIFSMSGASTPSVSAPTGYTGSYTNNASSNFLQLTGMALKFIGKLIKYIK